MIGKAVIICAAAVLLAAAPAAPVGRPDQGHGASVGPVRPAFVCVVVPCIAAQGPGLVSGVPRRAEAAPGSAPPRQFVPAPSQAAVPAPPGGLIFLSGLVALLWLRRRPGLRSPVQAAGLRPPAVVPWVSPSNSARRGGLGPRAARLFGRRRGA